jgi:prolyl-tRNA synthetase
MIFISRHLYKENMNSETFYELLKKSMIADINYPIKGVNVLLPEGKSILNKLEDIIFSKYNLMGYCEVDLPAAVPKRFLKHLESHSLFKVNNDYRGFYLSPSVEVQSLVALSSMTTSVHDLPLRFIVKSKSFRENNTNALIKDIEFYSYELNSFFKNDVDANIEREKADNIFDSICNKLGIPILNIRENPSSGPYKKITFYPFSNSYANIYWSAVLGTKYTEKIDELIGRKLKPAPIQLNIGITSRLLTAYLANNSDEKGFIQKRVISPYIVMVPQLKTLEKETSAIVNSLDALKISYKLINCNKRKQAFERFYSLGVPFMISPGVNELQLASRLGNITWIQYEELNNIQNILYCKNDDCENKIEIIETDHLPSKHSHSVFKVDVAHKKTFDTHMKLLGYIDESNLAYVNKKY